MDAIEAEMRKAVPALKDSGGYILSSNHPVLSSVPLENFRYITRLTRELGRY